MFIGAFIVVACFIGVLFIYDYFVPMAGHKPAALEKKGQEVVSSKKAATAPKQKIQDKTSAYKTLAKSSTKTFKNPRKYRDTPPKGETPGAGYQARRIYGFL